uniref:Uncharacterized protein n=1 Tax=viral metagenome TaxID=1070528 RepID=A0A6C0KZ78_9ZZZZ
MDHQSLVIHSDSLITSEDKQIFINRIQSIICLQLVFICMYLSLCYFSKPIHDFLISDVGSATSILIFYCSFIHFTILLCHPTDFRHPPYSWINLIMFTLFLAYNIGYLSVIFNPDFIVLSGISSLSLFAPLTAYSVQNKIEYTIHGNIILIGLLSFILFCSMNALLKDQTNNIILSLGGSQLLPWFVLYDTHSIVEGENTKYGLAMNEYVFGTLTIYYDIIHSFIKLPKVITHYIL